MPKLTLELHAAQQAFLDSEAAYRGFVGGRGAGKSYIGALDLLLRAQDDRLYGVYAPTYPMLRDSSWRAFLELGHRLHFVRNINRSEMRVTLGNGAEVIFRSVDDPEKARGPNLSGAWLDEASLMAQDAYTIIIACLRERGQQGWLSATFTPRGKVHWTYETFGQGRPNTALFHARTVDNPFLPPAFGATLAEQYTSAFARQELDGEFIDALGAMFQRFWLPIIDACPVGRAVRYWDKAGTAGAGDYSAGVKIVRAADDTYCIADVVRGQWSAGQRNTVIAQTAALDGQQTAIWIEQEPGSGGKESAEISVRELAGYNVHAAPVTGEKWVRAMPLAAQCEAGNVKLAAGVWNAAFIDELVQFPSGAHDDQVDAAAGAFAKVVRRKGFAPV